MAFDPFGFGFAFGVFLGSALGLGTTSCDSGFPLLLFTSARSSLGALAARPCECIISIESQGPSLPEYVFFSKSTLFSFQPHAYMFSQETFDAAQWQSARHTLSIHQQDCSLTTKPDISHMSICT